MDIYRRTVKIMKICVLTHTFPRNSQDSAAAFMNEFCDSLVKNGNKVIVLTPFDRSFDRTGDSYNVETYKYIWPDKFHLLGYSRAMQADVTLRRINYILVPLMILFGVARLFRLIKKEKIDLISVHWIIPNGLIAYIVSKLTGTPYTVTLPGTDAYLASRNRFLGWISKIVATSSSGIFSNSRWHLDRILKLGVKLPIAEIITYPVDTNRFKPSSKEVDVLKQRLGLYKTTTVLLAVGRLVYKKGFSYLIKAMPGVLKQYPDTCLIIGGAGDLHDDLLTLINLLNLGGRVKLIGNIDRDKIAVYYNMADIVITPSILDQEGNVDGRPLVILESMSCGKAQVVTNLPGISDSLKNGQNAMLVAQRNSAELTTAICKLIENPKLRHSMGVLNRTLAEEQLSVEIIGKRYMYFFNKITKT